MKENFNKVYLNILNECRKQNKGAIVKEGIGRFLNNMMRTKKSKSGLIKAVLLGDEKTGKGGLFEANGFDGPFQNGSGSAEIWKGKINGSTLKIKMAESIYQDLTSDKPQEKKIPITIISVKYKKKKEIIISWSQTEDEVVAAINKAILQLGIKGFSFKSTGMNLKDEADKKEAAKHDSDADDDFSDEHADEQDEECDEQDDEQDDKQDEEQDEM